MKRVALVVFTSNSSLCGGFNNNVIKLMEQTVAEYKAQGASDILVYPVGRKVAEKVTKLGLPVAGNFTELADKPNPQGCQNISEELCRKFMAGEIDKVELIYHQDYRDTAHHAPIQGTHRIGDGRRETSSGHR